MMESLNCCSKCLPCFSPWLLTVYPPSTDDRLGFHGELWGTGPFNFFGGILSIKDVSIGNEVNDRTAPMLSPG